MTNVLALIPDSPGFYVPMRELLDSLPKSEYSITVASNSSLSDLFHDYKFISPTAQRLFDIGSWHDVEIAGHIFDVIAREHENNHIDIILTTQFSPSSLVASRKYDIPVITLSGFTPLWPCQGIILKNKDVAEIQEWRLMSWLSRVNSIADAKGIRRFCAADRVFGESLIVRNVEQLFDDVDDSIFPVHFVGSLSPSMGPDLSRAINGVGRVYFQHGRSFEDNYAWDLLQIVSQEMGVEVLVDMARFDGRHRPVGLPDVTFIDGGLDIYEIRSGLRLIVSSGGATPVLAALELGVPQIIYQSSSGSEDVIGILAPKGLCSFLDVNADISVLQVRKALDKLLSDEKIQKLQEVSKLFDQKRQTRHADIRRAFSSVC